MRSRSGALLIVIMAVSLAACGGRAGTDTGAGTASGSCAMILNYHHQRYEGRSVRVSPPQGAPLGDAILPGCNDTGRAHDPPDQRVPVARLPGVSPKIALVWPGQKDLVLIREGTDTLPRKVSRLLHAPNCDKKDVPIRLSGPWLGIIGIDGKTEVDLVPPYKIDLLAVDASTHDYENAFLTVLVPHSLGSVLTKDDVRSSLWKGGTIDFVARCHGPRFVAERVASKPPK
jgi:Family of unknown function (DUF6281)